MAEMTPAERQALNLLRKNALADMSDADFANLESEVANKGLRNLDGWYAVVVRKAVTAVLKHPGHPDQSVHAGGRGKGKGGGAPTPGTAPVSSGTQAKLDKAEEIARESSKREGASTVHEANAQSIKEQKRQMEQADVKIAVSQAHKNDQLFRASQETARSYDEMASEYRMKGNKQMAEASAKIAAERRDISAFHFNLAGAWASHATDLGASEADLVRKQKTVEPVVKHPGHADQSVHGGGRGKGKGGASAPASAPSGGGGYNAKQAQTLIKDSDESLSRLTDSLGAAQRQISLGTTGDTRTQALGRLESAASSLRLAKQNIDLAAKMNGSDRGTVQSNMDAAKRHVQRANENVRIAVTEVAGFGRNSKTWRKFDDEVAVLEYLVTEGLEGGVL